MEEGEEDVGCCEEEEVGEAVCEGAAGEFTKEWENHPYSLYLILSSHYIYPTTINNYHNVLA